MKVIRKIEIEEADMSELHAEITDVMGYFKNNSLDDSWVKEELPNLQKLYRVLTSQISREPRDRVYEKMSKLTNRIEPYLRVISPNQHKK